MFKFSQATLLKVRKIWSDQALQAFALTQRRILECRQAIEHNRALAEDLQAELAGRLQGGVQARELMRLTDYQTGLRAQAVGLKQQLTAAEEAAEVSRQQLLKAKTELKAMERLKEIELERYRAEIERQEMLFIDEIAVSRHGKNL